MHKVGVKRLYLFYPHSMADQPPGDFLQQYRANIVYRKTREPDCVVCACAVDQNQDGGHFFASEGNGLVVTYLPISTFKTNRRTQ